MNTVGILGAGRMGRGIALHFALTGGAAVLIDLKPRADEDFTAYKAQAFAELAADLAFLIAQGLLAEAEINTVLGQIELLPAQCAHDKLAQCNVIFEGVPEIKAAKEEAFAYASLYCHPNALIASTSSTMAVTELAEMVSQPGRFMNAHWLNPAHIIPLVEISRGPRTEEDSLQRMRQLLESVGKVTVVCSDRPGYIVPRLQALIMNEAARMVEEGVASAEDIDKAVMTGFGPRYATLGVLEFVDWGGVDIVYYASNYLKKQYGDRFAPATIINSYMAQEQRGIRDGKGFYDYSKRDVAAYRDEKMRHFTDLLSYRDLLPKFHAASKK